LLDGKEVELDRGLEESRKLGRRTAVLFAAAIAIALAFLPIGFLPEVQERPWLDTLLVRIEFIAVLGFGGVAMTSGLLLFYMRYSISRKGRALVFPPREKLAYTMIIWIVLGTTVVALLWYKWGPHFI